MPLSSGPFSTMMRLSPIAYIQEPRQISSPSPSQLQDTGEESSSRSAPKIIVLMTWMSAQPLHIAKYIDGYQELYPDSRIVLVRSAPADFFYRSTRKQNRWLAPVVDAVNASCATGNDKSANLLLHNFSNGGFHHLLNLLRTYQEKTSRPFPAHVKILDSCPGRGTFQESINAVSASFPRSQPLRMILVALLYLVISLYWLTFVPYSIPDPIERIRRALNDKNLMSTEARRCYIYSTKDSMVGWRDVEAHAQDAEGVGFVVRKERFDASEHCAHVRIDGSKRYWGIVQDFWQSGVNK